MNVTWRQQKNCDDLLSPSWDAVHGRCVDAFVREGVRVVAGAPTIVYGSFFPGGLHVDEPYHGPPPTTTEHLVQLLTRQELARKAFVLVFVG